MKRVSIFSYILFGTLIVQFSYLFYDWTIQAVDFQNEMVIRKAQEVSRLFDKLKEEPDQAKLFEKLKYLQDFEKISFYITKKDREPASSSLPDFVGSDFIPTYDGQVQQVFNKGEAFPVALYIGEKINNTQIAVGRFLETDYIERNIRENQKHFWPVIGIMAVNLILVLSFALKDINHLMATIRWGTASRRFKSTSFRSKEAHAIATALTQASDQIAKAESELELTRKQLLPSLLNEMNSEHEPPYEFDAILARIDINNATEVYTNPSLKHIQQYWFDYFKLNAAEIATRYGGYAHEELGDEIILYFKLRENENGYVLALSAMRDIFNMTDFINQKTLEEFNYSFRIKGVLDSGKLRVFKSSLGGGSDSRLKIEGLSGQSKDGSQLKNLFLSTVRLLKMVEDKTQNSLIVSDSILTGSKDAILSHSPVLGIPTQYHQFGQYSWVKNFSKFDFSSAKENFIHRSDQDLILVFNHLVNDKTLRSEDRLAWIKLLRGIMVPSPSIDLQKAWLTALKKMMDSTWFGYDTRILATFIASGEIFIKALHVDLAFEKEFESVLLNCILHSEPRIQANAIELWGKLNLQFAALAGHMKLFRHNRSLANALVVSLNQELSPKALKVLKRMMKQKEPLMKAAACYATAKIIEHYQAANPIIIHSNPEIQDLINYTTKLVSHENEMVSRQAKRVEAVLITEILTDKKSA